MASCHFLLRVYAILVCGAMASASCPNTGVVSVAPAISPNPPATFPCGGSGLTIDSINITFAAGSCLGPYTMTDSHKVCGGTVNGEYCVDGAEYYTTSFRGMGCVQWGLSRECSWDPVESYTRYVAGVSKTSRNCPNIFENTPVTPVHPSSQPTQQQPPVQQPQASIR